MEQLDYNFLYRWFVGLSPDDPVWDPTTFTKNRDRLQNGEVFTKFMSKLLNHPQVKPLLSDEHFSVDGTLIEAWASQKSFRPKDGSGDDDDGANFHGQKRKNDMHASTSDPDILRLLSAIAPGFVSHDPGYACFTDRPGPSSVGPWGTRGIPRAMAQRYSAESSMRCGAFDVKENLRCKSCLD
jgi:hypothetical protein